MGIIRPTKENQSFILDNNVRVVSKLKPNASCEGCYFDSDNGCTTDKLHSEEIRCCVFDVYAGASLNFIYESVND